MLKIGLHKADKTKFPNLALLKLSAWHKAQGDDVKVYDPLFASCFDKVYSSKVFTFTPESRELFGTIENGGSGYDYKTTLPDEIEHFCPDYSGIDYSIGFLTRGCCNKCPWCIVPKKEGELREHADIEEFLRHKAAVLMDNNVLASPHGIRQIEKIIRLQIRVDFNQGLDARLIDDTTAKLLSRVRWLRPIRLACDTIKQMGNVENAVKLLRKHGAKPQTFFVYCLVRGVEDAMMRVTFLRDLKVDPFAQPLQDGVNKPTKEQMRFARWVNHKAIFKTVKWQDYH